MEKLEGAPAILYSVFWQTKAMGHLKKVLDEIGVKDLKILIFLEDFLPGAMISLDGKEGEFEIKAINKTDNIEYDGAFFGELKYILNLISGHLLTKGFWYLVTRKIKLKGIRSLLKFLKIIQQVAI